MNFQKLEDYIRENDSVLEIIYDGAWTAELWDNDGFDTEARGESLEKALIKLEEKLE